VPVFVIGVHAAIETMPASTTATIADLNIVNASTEKGPESSLA